MRSYCTQNEGDCGTCSLVSYGRDCHNNTVRACSHCGAFVDTLPFEELFGRSSTASATLCDKCYAAERAGFMGPLEPYRGEKISDNLLS